MSVKMQPTSLINASLGINPGGRVEKYFVSECAKAMDKYVPFDEGNLAQYIIQGNFIIYDQIYANYIYNGISKSGKRLNYQKDKHPLATCYWDRVMWSAEGNDIVKRVQDKIGR